TVLVPLNRVCVGFTRSPLQEPQPANFWQEQFITVVSHYSQLLHTPQTYVLRTHPYGSIQYIKEPGAYSRDVMGISSVYNEEQTFHGLL
ncbi:unnamed protein product, partial [Allacma fusca]